MSDDHKQWTIVQVVALFEFVNGSKEDAKLVGDKQLATVFDNIESKLASILKSITEIKERKD